MIFESDSETLVASLNDKHHGVSEFFDIVSNIIYKLTLYSNFEVKFIRRQTNMTTYTFAQTHVLGLVTVFFSFLLLVLNIC